MQPRELFTEYLGDIERFILSNLSTLDIVRNLRFVSKLFYNEITKIITPQGLNQAQKKVKIRPIINYAIAHYMLRHSSSAGIKKLLDIKIKPADYRNDVMKTFYPELTEEERYWKHCEVNPGRKLWSMDLFALIYLNLLETEQIKRMLRDLISHEISNSNALRKMIYLSPYELNLICAKEKLWWFLKYDTLEIIQNNLLSIPQLLLIEDQTRYVDFKILMPILKAVNHKMADKHIPYVINLISALGKMNDKEKEATYPYIIKGLTENLFTLKELDNNINYLRILCTEVSCNAYKEGLITFPKAAKLLEKSGGSIFRNHGIEALRNKYFDIDEALNYPYVIDALLNDTGIKALRENLITVKKAAENMDIVRLLRDNNSTALTILRRDREFNTPEKLPNIINIQTHIRSYNARNQFGLFAQLTKLIPTASIHQLRKLTDIKELIDHNHFSAASDRLGQFKR